MSKPYKTAIVRKRLSTPTQYLVDSDLIKGDLLDYGCGHGFDGRKLNGDLFDPFYYPQNRKEVFSKKYDTIICNYVLNVLTEKERERVINKISGLLKPSGKAYVSVRRDIKGCSLVSTGAIQVEVYPDLESFKKTGTYEMYIIGGKNVKPKRS